MTDTRTTRRRRAYKQLIMAILEHAPEEDIKMAAMDYADSGYSAADFEENILKAIVNATKDAQNYFPHYQRGCGIPILRKSPLGRKLSRGAFAPEGEEA